MNMRLKQCKKCNSSAGISGPTYDPTIDMLRYRCTCGYTWTEPTADSRGRP